jgi:hypothetical protein
MGGLLYLIAVILIIGISNYFAYPGDHQEGVTALFRGKGLNKPAKAGRMTGSFLGSIDTYERTKICFPAAECGDTDHPGDLFCHFILGGGCDHPFAVCDHLFEHALPHVFPVGEMGLS